MKQRIEKMLSNGMHEGNMHVCLRDAGRLAGGALAAGELYPGDIDDLRRQAMAAAKNSKQAERKWTEAVEYGRGQPLDRPTHGTGRGAVAMAWDSVIPGAAVVDPRDVCPHPVEDPGSEWQPATELADYLDAMFLPGEYPCVQINYRDDGEKLKPFGSGDWGRTAGELSAVLRMGMDVTEVFIGTSKKAGVWIRVNPLLPDADKAIDANVAAFRHALIECDTISVEKQAGYYSELNLPITATVHSGGKSLHALVRVDAKDIHEYRERVKILYEFCEQNGLQLDGANRNPSRLSRMPGVMRNGRKQYLHGLRQGAESWNAWIEWVEARNDTLPAIENAADFWADIPPLRPELIKGVLRTGHKLLLAGPSKAGKSFALIQLAIGIAEKAEWMGWPIETQGRVLYVNLELDSISIKHRFRDVYRCMGLVPDNLENIDVWNLRGKSRPMNDLAPRLIRRAKKREYIAIIIDPIYKVITGDENAAHEMSKFCNEFDRICSALDTSVIYCHHHSKGNQGQKKSADRASGSGVFARDPDALLDFVELEIDEKRRKILSDRIESEAMRDVLDAGLDSWDTDVPESVAYDPDKLIDLVNADDDYALFRGDVRAARAAARERADEQTGWRVEGTLREFATPKPVRLWFDYPLHYVDKTGLLDDALAAGEEDSPSVKKAKNKAIWAEKIDTLNDIIGRLKTEKPGEPVTVYAVAEHTIHHWQTVARWCKKAGYSVGEGGVIESKK